MGTFKQGILGGFSGKVGNVVGSIWKGVCTMRAMPASVTNPRTPAQLEQRAKFTLIIKFLQTITAFLRVGFRSQASKMTAFNAAFKYNITNAIAGTYPAFSIDYPQASVSRGALTGALNPEIVSTTAGEVDITWEDNSLVGNASGEDKVMLVIFNPTSQQSIVVTGGNTRVSGSQTLVLPASFSGEVVHCYIGFLNAANTVANSLYAGSVLVA